MNKLSPDQGLNLFESKTNYEIQNFFDTVVLGDKSKIISFMNNIKEKFLVSKKKYYDELFPFCKEFVTACWKDVSLQDLKESKELFLINYKEYALQKIQIESFKIRAFESRLYIKLNMFRTQFELIKKLILLSPKILNEVERIKIQEPKSSRWNITLKSFDNLNIPYKEIFSDKFFNKELRNFIAHESYIFLSNGILTINEEKNGEEKEYCQTKIDDELDKITSILQAIFINYLDLFINDLSWVKSSTE